MPNWTEDKNQRRCDLIDKGIDGVLTPDEAEELEQLQKEMYVTRSPMLQQELTALREMYEELIEESNGRTVAKYSYELDE